jgi:hypothetical protein
LGEGRRPGGEASSTVPAGAVLDHNSIRNLLVRCAYALDAEDAEGFAACFETDGELQAVLHDSDEGLHVRGRPGLRRFASMVGEEARGDFGHAFGEPRIEVAGNRAQTLSYVLIPHHYLYGFKPLSDGSGRLRQCDNPTFGMTGVCRDDLIKCSGEWRISRRRFWLDGLLHALDGGDQSAARGLLPVPEQTRPRTAATRRAGPVRHRGGSDYQDIRQLLSKWGQSLDFGDLDGFSGCFTTDGALDTGVPEDELQGSYRGHEQLRRFAQRSRDVTAGHVRHWAVNPLIEVDGAQARVSSYAITTRDHGPSNVPLHATYFSTLVTTGMYSDDLVRVEGRWLFARRTFRHDGLPDVVRLTRNPIMRGLDGAPAAPVSQNAAPGALSGLDYEQIRQLHARYCHAIDFADLEAFTACFAPDGLFDGVNESYRGHEDLRAFAAGIARKDAGHGRHSVLCSLIEGDGLRATSRSYAVITRDYGAPLAAGVPTHSAVLGTGIYEDSLIKVEGRWVYAVRRFRFDGTDQQRSGSG